MVIPLILLVLHFRAVLAALRRLATGDLGDDFVVGRYMAGRFE